jgi:phospholipid N-methyltransferase
MSFTATYSPDDNKLRLYASSRLEPDLYARVRAAGFIWAPKQDLFVAPMWTPGREDLLIEIAGQIDDEDGSLVDRAEERAERFEDYSDKRAADSERARKDVDAICEHIPLGQPILVGHHSERYARKDAERIETGMRKTIKMWETSKYWASRAAGAIQHAKYKELPAVRARRIKTIEADKRKQERGTAEATAMLNAWRKLTDENAWKVNTPIRDRAMFIANRSNISQKWPLADYPRDPPAKQYEGEMSLWSALDGDVITGEQAAAIAIPMHERGNARRARWIAHYENRLAYERAMLGDAGGTIADQTKPEKGGAVRCWVERRGWAYIMKVNKVSVTVCHSWGHGDNFPVTVPFDKLNGIMTAAEVAAARADGRMIEQEADSKGVVACFFLRDSAPEPVAPVVEASLEPAAPSQSEADIAAMKATLKAGIKVQAVNQLFPTPAHLAKVMVDLAKIEPGHTVLEPSAGTGAILDAIATKAPGAKVFAVEINHGLCETLSQRTSAPDGVCRDVLQGDFLECFGLGLFDKILMNPPFENGTDIKHIQHAAKMLKPGGTLVAICANGPRQQAALKPMASNWSPLPAGTFKDAGTGVNTVLLVING